MPTKAPPDETAMFFFNCLKHGNSQINFEAVGAVYGLNKNQAYQRYWRLSKHCEAGNVGTTQNSDKTDGGESVPAAGAKGKRKAKPAEAGIGNCGKKRKLDKPDDTSDNAEENNGVVKFEDGHKVKTELED